MLHVFLLRGRVFKVRKKQHYSLPNAHLASLGQRHHTFHRCCMVLNWPQPSQFPLLLDAALTLCFAGQIPFPRASTGAEFLGGESKSQDGGSMEVCIYMYCRSSDLFTLSLHCCRLARLTRAFNSYASVVAVVACQPSFHTCWTTIFGFFWGGGIAGFCRHIACLGF